MEQSDYSQKEYKKLDIFNDPAIFATHLTAFIYVARHRFIV